MSTAGNGVQHERTASARPRSCRTRPGWIRPCGPGRPPAGCVRSGPRRTCRRGCASGRLRWERHARRGQTPASSAGSPNSGSSPATGLAGWPSAPTWPVRRWVCATRTRSATEVRAGRGCAAARVLVAPVREPRPCSPCRLWGPGAVRGMVRAGGRGLPARTDQSARAGAAAAGGDPVVAVHPRRAEATPRAGATIDPAGGRALPGTRRGLAGGPRSG